MTIDQVFRSKLVDGANAVEASLTWRSVVKASYDEVAMAIGVETATDYPGVLGWVYTVDSAPSQQSKVPVGAKSRHSTSQAIHDEDIQAIFPIPEEGLGFTPKIDDFVIWNGRSWRVTWVLELKGMTSPIAYHVGAVHG